MKRSEALKKLERVLETIKQGGVPYRILEVTVYGSVTKREDPVGDLDLYLQLDRESVPDEDLLNELTGALERGIGRRLRKALKKSRQERIQVQWDFEPWEERKRKFTKPGEIDVRVDTQLEELTIQNDEEPKSWKDQRDSLERHRKKVKAKGYEWPPRGFVVFRARGDPDITVEKLMDEQT